MSDSPRVVVVVPTRTGLERECLEALHNQDYPDFVVLVVMVPDRPTGFKDRSHYSALSTRSRQAGREAALGMKANLFLFIDDDVVLPPDAISQLVRERRDVMFGWYKMITGPLWVAANLFKRGASWIFVRRRAPVPSVANVDMGGLGCVLVTRKVLEKVPFETGLDMTVATELQPSCYAGPCVKFSRDCAAAGFRLLISGHVICGHKDRKTGAIIR